MTHLSWNDVRARGIDLRVGARELYTIIKGNVIKFIQFEATIEGTHTWRRSEQQIWSCRRPHASQCMYVHSQNLEQAQLEVKRIKQGPEGNVEISLLTSSQDDESHKFWRNDHAGELEPSFAGSRVAKSCSAHGLVVTPFIPNSMLPALIRLWLVRLRRLCRSAEDLRWTTGESEAFWV